MFVEKKWAMGTHGHSQQIQTVRILFFAWDPAHLPPMSLHLKRAIRRARAGGVTNLIRPPP
jgi:hypothetical protein